MAVSHDLYRPVVRLIIALVILAIINWILTSLPMLKELVIPKLPISTSAIISVVIGIIMISILVTFLRDFAPRLQAAFPRFPEGGAIVAAAVTLAVITVAYTMFDEAILPFLGNFAWLYPVVFLVIAIWPIYKLVVTLYRSSDKLADLTTRKIAEASGEFKKCPNCGETSPGIAKYCPKCSTQLALPGGKTVTVECPSCGEPNRPDDTYCLTCGKPLTAG